MPDRTYPGTDKYNQGPESLAEVVPVPEYGSDRPS